MVCSGTGMGAAWHLAHITVTNTVTNESARFNYNNWLDDKKGWSHTLYADGVDAAKVRDCKRGTGGRAGWGSGWVWRCATGFAPQEPAC